MLDTYYWSLNTASARDHFKTNTFLRALDGGRENGAALLSKYLGEAVGLS